MDAAQQTVDRVQLAAKFMKAFEASHKEVRVGRVVHENVYEVEAAGVPLGRNVMHGIAVFVRQDLSDLDLQLELVRLAFMRAAIG